MKLIQELMSLVDEVVAEQKKLTPWQILNKLAADRHGEFGFATLSYDDAAQYVDMKKADAIADRQFGDSFLGMDESSMKSFINRRPELLKGAAARMAKAITEGAFKDLHVDLLDAIHHEFDVDDDMAWQIAEYVLTGDDNDKVEAFLYDHFAKSGQMPYGVQKARDGDPASWIADKLSDMFAKQVKAITAAEKTVKEDWAHQTGQHCSTRCRR